MIKNNKLYSRVGGKILKLPPFGQWVFDKSRKFGITTRYIFASGGKILKLPPSGQWVFDKSLKFVIITRYYLQNFFGLRRTKTLRLVSKIIPLQQTRPRGAANSQSWATPWVSGFLIFFLCQLRHPNSHKGRSETVSLRHWLRFIT